jgi:hypothetical protein
MKQSNHAPQVFDVSESDENHDKRRVASATIPFCWYYKENITNSGMHDRSEQD